MSDRKRCVAPKVREAFAFLLAHMITGGFIHPSDRVEPTLAPHLMRRDGGDSITNVIMVVDRIFSFVSCGWLATGSLADAQKFRIEELFFSLRVNLKVRLSRFRGGVRSIRGSGRRACG